MGAPAAPAEADAPPGPAQLPFPGREVPSPGSGAGGGPALLQHLGCSGGSTCEEGARARRVVVRHG